MRQILDGYMAKNPGVKVEVTSLPWGQAFEKLVAPSVIGKDETDIAGLSDSLQRMLHILGRGGAARPRSPRGSCSSARRARSMTRGPSPPPARNRRIS